MLLVAAVAGFAELLRKSRYARVGELETIRTIVDAQINRDGDRREFAQLLERARALLATRRCASSLIARRSAAAARALPR